MARFKGKDLYLEDDDQAYFGNNQEAALWYIGNELRLDHTISGTLATQGHHLVRKDQVPDDFLDLVDTPITYSGHAGDFVAVKQGEDGLEFVTVSGVQVIDNFIDLTDTPITYSGQANKLLWVNDAESGVEFTTLSGVLYVPLTPGTLMPGDVGARPDIRIANPVGGYAFDDSNVESCYATIRIPHNYISNTDLTLEFCCFNNEVQTGSNTVRWSVDYHLYQPGDLFTSKTTSTYSLDLAFPNNAPAGTFGHNPLVIPYNDVNNPLTQNRALAFRVYRDSIHANDTLTGDIVLIIITGLININIGD